MRAVRDLRRPFDRYPFAREALVAVAVFGAFGLWIQVATRFGNDVTRGLGVAALGADTLPTFALYGAASSAVAVVAMLAFVGAYVVLRDVDVPLGRVDGRVAAYVLAGGLGAALLVGALKAVAVASGTTVSALVGTAVAADPDVGLALTITGLGLLLALPTYLLTTHVVVQRTVDRAAGDGTVVATTTLLVWLVEPTGLLSVSVDRFAVVVVLLVLAIALPVVAATFERRWLTILAAVPVFLLIGGAVLDRIVNLQGLTEGTFALAQLVVVAFGVVAYQRTDSVLPSAFAYATFVVAVDVVVVTLEAGVGI